MNTQRIWKLIVMIATLTILMFGLSVIDYVNLSVQAGNPVMHLLVAFLQVLALSLVSMRSHKRGWPLIMRIFISLYGISTLMVAIEAIYLPETLPVLLVISLLVNGGVRSLIYSAVSVLVWQAWLPGESIMAADVPASPAWRWSKWAGKFALIGLIWAVLFVMGGALVFLPLARLMDPDALASYVNLDMPAWVLPFQIIRGMLWALLTLPLISSLRGSRRMKASIIGFLYMVIMGSNLLLADSLPLGIRTAHLVEVCLENLIFGVLVTLILTPRSYKLGGNMEKHV